MGRRNLTRINDPLFADAQPQFDEESLSPYQARLLRRALRQVWDSALTPRQKRYMDCYYRRNMNLCEIALEESVSPSTVSRTLHRARKRISRILQYYIIQ